MINFLKGNIFDSDAEALVNAVNTVVGIAQLAEHRSPKPKVEGSSPSAYAKL